MNHKMNHSFNFVVAHTLTDLKDFSIATVILVQRRARRNDLHIIKLHQQAHIKEW